MYRPSEPDEKLIAKKVREGSNELKIFDILDSIQLKSMHVVSLVDSFRTRSGLWVILPKMSTISNYLAISPSQLSGKADQVCQGLIKGLAYLHGYCIAHRDIKPQNLIIGEDFCLKIIDFDLALQVKDEDEEVDDQCGTENWLAPEIAKKVMYSPIKADRWSCGRVILYFLDKFKKEDKHLRSFANRLTAHDPKRRPSLLEWASPSDTVANVSNTGERRALRPRRLQDKMESGSGHPPPPLKAKRRRTAESGQERDGHDVFLIA